MTDRIQAIQPPDAPIPAGHYTPGISAGGFIFVSGHPPKRDDGNPGSFEAQVRSAMASVFAVSNAAGFGRQDLVKVTAYVVGVDHWPEFNRVYADLMGAARPARAVVPVPQLHYGYLVEIEAIALAPTR